MNGQQPQGRNTATPQGRMWQITALAMLLCATGALIVFSPKAPRKRPPPPTVADVARADRSKADAVFNSPKAKTAYKQFIDKWKDSPDKRVQDEVGAARIRLAYATAKDKDYERARSIFKEAALQYRGTGEMRSDFGGIKDQALYQAAACLNAEGKKQEARKALVEFIQTQPMSPLVDGAYKRIVAIDGKSSKEVDALLQTALDKQEKSIRFETSVCGPKCIVKLLGLLHHPAVILSENQASGEGSNRRIPDITTALGPSNTTTPNTPTPIPADYRAIAKLCGTTDKGTTMEGLRKGLKAFGLSYFGFEVSKDDLGKIETPAILFLQNHYVVVTKVSGKILTIYDPMREKESDLDYDKTPQEVTGAILLLRTPPGGGR